MIRSNIKKENVVSDTAVADADFTLTPKEDIPTKTVVTKKTIKPVEPVESVEVTVETPVKSKTKW